jgi:Protein of unknown function (DUF3048) N-terminal domain/Protein of unknown function (DUF3048) C-terminal domain
MPRTLPRALRLSFLVLLAALAACDSVTPTPLPLPSPTVLAVKVPTATDTPLPSPTPSATATDTVTPSPTNSPSPSPVARAPRRGAVGDNVYFMSQLISYFNRLGPYPPEAVPSRPSNINPLTGLPVSDPALLQRRPILARLGNDPGARPHAGLNQADLVFEEMIDQRGGFFAITRLTAVFLGQNATVRPFRSARQVNASLQPMFDGALAHSGAGKGVRFLLSNLPWGKPTTRSLNLDDLFYGSTYCTIGNSYINRMASTVEHIHATLAAQGLEKDVPLRGFDFSPNAPGGAPTTSIAFDHTPWPYTTASILWKYDPASGRYLRFMGGAPHLTQQYAITGKWGGACNVTGPITTEQVSAANVVVLNADYEPTDARDFTEDSLGSTSVFIGLTGSGTAHIYRDGVQISGTWQRPTLQHFFQFVDANGNTIPLKPGNTWFEIAPLGYVPTTH